MSGNAIQTNARKPLTILIAFLAIGVLIVLLMSVSSRFFYFFEQVNQDEVGVQLESGRIQNIVGPASTAPPVCLWTCCACRARLCLLRCRTLS